MLNINVAKKIGFDACIDRLGRSFVMKNRDLATSAFGEEDNYVYCFVGVDNRYDHPVDSNMLVLDSKTEFPYRASCNVSLEDGTLVFLELVSP